MTNNPPTPGPYNPVRRTPWRKNPDESLVNAGGAVLVPDSWDAKVAAAEAAAAAAAVSVSDAAAVVAEGISGAGLKIIFDDEFAGGALGADWSVVNPNPAAMRVTGGTLELDYTPGTNPEGANATPQNIVVLPCPQGSWIAECEVAPTVTQNGQRAAIVAFRSQRDFAALQYQGTGTTWRRQFLHEKGDATRSLNTVDFDSLPIATLPALARWRLVCDGDRVIAYESIDSGATWQTIGRPAPADMFNYVGVWAQNGGTVSGTASFKYFRLSGAVEAPAAPPPNECNPFTMYSTSRIDPAADTLSVTLRDILRNSDKYTLNTWIPATYGAQGVVDYYDLGGTTETFVRGPAMAAFGLACSLWTRAYDQTAGGGVTLTNARAAAIKLAVSVAKANLANSPGTGWGESVAAPNGSQSSHWAWFAGQAAWMLWEYLTDQQRTYVRRMVASEATREARMVPQFWKTPAGVEYSDRVGDSASEESAWRGNLLALAAAMIPTHRHRAAWERRAIDLMATSFSRLEDVTSSAILNGRELSDYCNTPILGTIANNSNFTRNTVGFNINSDGTVVNHGIVHPDYMAAVLINLQNVTIYALAGRQSPKAATHNAKLVYSAMTDLNFSTGSGWEAPGGTIYTPASDAIYYPAGTDWGASRRMDKACLDAMIDSFKLDDGVGTTANTWGQLHANAALAMQARDTTGQTYQPADDDTYALREQWVAWLAGVGYLSRVVAANYMVRFTNAAI